MASDFFKGILEKEIVSKVDVLISKESSDISDYKLLLNGKGMDFELTSLVENSTEAEGRKIMNITVNGAISLLNAQMEEYDFFNPSEIKNLSYVLKSKVKTEKQGIQGNIRLRSGRFANPMQLSHLINRSLEPLVRNHMGVRGSLVNRTGRLASSGFVSNIIANADNKKTIYFNYLKRPYSVFEPPNTYRGLASEARDPRRLFAKAITDALNKLLHRNEIVSNIFTIRNGNYTVGTSRGGILNER